MHGGQFLSIWLLRHRRRVRTRRPQRLAAILRHRDPAAVSCHYQLPAELCAQYDRRHLSRDTAICVIACGFGDISFGMSNQKPSTCEDSRPKCTTKPSAAAAINGSFDVPSAVPSKMIITIAIVATFSLRYAKHGRLPAPPTSGYKSATHPVHAPPFLPLTSENA